MMNRIQIFLLVLFTFVSLVFSTEAIAKDYKVLVVMSYEVGYPWDKEVKDGIDSVLSEKAELRYFYMDTKSNLGLSAQKGKEAYEFYKVFKPDGVIAMDDNAQKDFVLPHIKGKEDIPVMFGGVNAEPETYGYPTDRISGILDRFHISESISLAQQMIPGIKTVSFILKESPTARLIKEQVDKEKGGYSAGVTGFNMVKTLDEALNIAEASKKSADLMFVAVLSGVKDKEGKALTEKEAVRRVSKVFGGPTITNLAGNVKNGILCAVVKTGQEQGIATAEMLLKALEGTPVKELPVRRNRHGRRMINATVLKELGIKPNAAMLLGSKIVKTEL